MGDALAELRLPRGQFIEVHVEVIARQAAEVDQVGFGHRASMGKQGFTDPQVVEVAAEGMNLAFVQDGAADVLAGDTHEHGRGALDCGALQIVLYRAQAAQLFTTTGATGAAMLEHGQRGAVAGGFGGGFTVEDMQAAMQGGHGRCHPRGDLRRAGDQGSYQAALAAGRQYQGFVQIVVAHQGADRAEGFDVMGAPGGMGIAAAQQGRGEEGAVPYAVTTGLEAVAGAMDELAGGEQGLHALRDIGLLGVGRQGTHLHPFHRRIADHQLGQAGAQAFGHGIEVLVRDDGAANGGAFLPGLGGHLARYLADEELKFLIVGCDVRGEDGAVQRIRLGVEGNRTLDQVGRDPQPGSGVRRAGEGDHVLAL